MALVEFGWRRFFFFDKISIQDPNDSTKKFNAFKDLLIECWTAGRGFVLLGEKQGAIFKLSRDLDIQAWKAYQNQLYDLSLAGDLFATVGDDGEDGNRSILKIWDLDRWEKNSPFCKLYHRINANRKTHANNQAVAVSLNQAHTLMVVGFSDTSVFFTYGDIVNERSIKWKSLREGANALGDGSLVGLKIATIGKYSLVFVIAENSLSSHILEGGNVLRKIVHDAKGCNRNCWFFKPEINQLIVTNDEMVYFYDAERLIESDSLENGRCHALGRGNDKLQLVGDKNHVALLTKQLARIPSGSSSMMSMLTIYDVECKYIAFSCSMPFRDAVPPQTFTLDEEIYVLNSDGSLSKFVEKPLHSKLEILLKKNLFELAIALAKRHKSPDLYSIYGKYGDSLYKKGEFETAIRQYIETIGNIEPSYVIKKFLDGTRIAQLCLYLEHLHRKNLAIGQHTTLLLSAYIKMNAKEKLESFIEASKGYKEFDIDNTIKLLRASDIPDVASRLALNNGRSQAFLSIQIEDMKRYTSAVNYLKTLRPSQVCQYIELYGSTLLKCEEKETINLIEKLITDGSADIKQVLKLLATRPKLLEQIYDSAEESIQKDVRLRTAVLEYKLRNLDGAKGCPPQTVAEILSLVDEENFAEAFQLAQAHKFSPLIIMILKEQKRMDELLHFLLQEGEIREILKMDSEESLKNMWIEMINYITKKKDLDSSDLMMLLEKLKNSDFAHPLVILEILSRNEDLQISDVKEYVMKWLEEQNKIIAESEKGIKTNENKLVEMEKQIENLENNVQIFQMNKCSACDTSLQVPAVHFLCKHAYHLNCFESYSDNANQCPACESKPDKIRRPSGKESKGPLSYQQFQKELENSTDPMSLISEYISRGAFEPLP